MSQEFQASYLCSSLIILCQFQALHHPFTAPNPEDLGDLSSARALAYDMVYNGVEVPIYINAPLIGLLNFEIIM